MPRQRLIAKHQEGVEIPVVVLAGMTAPVARGIEKKICDAFARWHVIHQPSEARNDQFLYPERIVKGLLESLTDYAVKRQREQPRLPTPRQILLAYVPAEDDEKLVRAFDFFVFPVRLSKLGEYDVNHGRQYRHSYDFARNYTVEAIRASLPTFELLRSRLSTPGGREPFFLPPLNFHVSRESSIGNQFLEIRKGEQWVGSLSSLQMKKLGTKPVLLDSRDLFFPVDKSGHGFTRELLPDSSFDERRQFLQSNYRFGVRILTDGLHHDVQYDGKDLGGAIFQCCVQGRLSLAGTHANVYPNDRVLQK